MGTYQFPLGMVVTHLFDLQISRALMRVDYFAICFALTRVFCTGARAPRRFVGGCRRRKARAESRPRRRGSKCTFMHTRALMRGRTRLCCRAHTHACVFVFIRGAGTNRQMISGGRKCGKDGESHRKLRRERRARDQQKRERGDG
eukprot:6175395-Pleurochrysis_carterae.AAC.1